MKYRAQLSAVTLLNTTPLSNSHPSKTAIKKAEMTNRITAF
jgi:hypothetical protein